MRNEDSLRTHLGILLVRVIMKKRLVMFTVFGFVKVMSFREKKERGRGIQ